MVANIMCKTTGKVIFLINILSVTYHSFAIVATLNVFKRETHLFCLQCYIFLDDPNAVADILEKLIKGDEVRCLATIYYIYQLKRNSFVTSDTS